MGFNARQEKTLRAWEKDFKSINSKHEIRFLGGSDVQQIIVSKAYSSALLHMGGGHMHSLNLLLGEAKALVSHGVRIFENSPALEVSYGEGITVSTGRGSVKASKQWWACGSSEVHRDVKKCVRSGRNGERQYE